MSYLSIKERLKLPLNRDDLNITHGEVRIDRRKCTGCGLCASICVFSAIRMTGDGAGRKAAINDSGCCNSCGACTAICEEGAIAIGRYLDFGTPYRVLERGASLPPLRF